MGAGYRGDPVLCGVSASGQDRTCERIGLADLAEPDSAHNQRSGRWQMPLSEEFWFLGPHLTRVSMIFDVALLFTSFPVQITFPLTRDVMAAVAVHWPKETDYAVNEASSDSLQSTTATWTRASGHMQPMHEAGQYS